MALCGIMWQKLDKVDAFWTVDHRGEWGICCGTAGEGRDKPGTMALLRMLHMSGSRAPAMA
jgi:hypothetical protein